jgi:hypothetical protein
LHPGGSFAKTGLDENAASDLESVADGLAVGSLQERIGSALMSATILAIECKRIRTPVRVTIAASGMLIAYPVDSVRKSLDQR